MNRAEMALVLSVLSSLEQAPPEGRGDRRGQSWGFLRVLGWAGRASNGEYLWVVRCERERAFGRCGGMAIVRGTSLRKGLTRSCGCLLNLSRRAAVAARVAKARRSSGGQS